MEIWSILNSKYRTVICAGSRNDSGMGMSFTWHGSGMERVWNGYGTVYGTKWTLACKKKNCLFVFLTAWLERVLVWYGVVWYGMVNQDD